jgi:hypothetical protein
MIVLGCRFYGLIGPVAGFAYLYCWLKVWRNRRIEGEHPLSLSRAIERHAHERSYALVRAAAKPYAREKGRRFCPSTDRR